MNTKLVGWIVALAAINWGLVGLLDMNLVEAIFGSGSMLTKIVYIVVGLAGVYKLYNLSLGKKKK